MSRTETHTITIPPGVVSDGRMAEILAEWCESTFDLDRMPDGDVRPISASWGGGSATIVAYPSDTTATVVVTLFGGESGQ